MGGVVETPQNGGTFLFSKGNSELLSEECLLSEDKYKTAIEPIFFMHLSSFSILADGESSWLKKKIYVSFERSNVIA